MELFICSIKHNEDNSYDSINKEEDFFKSRIIAKRLRLYQVYSLTLQIKLSRKEITIQKNCTNYCLMLLVLASSGISMDILLVVVTIMWMFLLVVLCNYYQQWHFYQQLPLCGYFTSSTEYQWFSSMLITVLFSFSQYNMIIKFPFQMYLSFISIYSICYTILLYVLLFILHSMPHIYALYTSVYISFSIYYYKRNFWQSNSSRI